MSELSSQQKAEIAKLLEQGNRLQAIQYAREAFNISLKDSVRLVNTVDQELHPDKKINIDSFAQGAGLPKIFYIIFGGSGVIMVIIAAIMFYYDQSAASRSVKIVGEVVDFRYDDDGLSAPIVKYNWEGDDLTYYGNTYSSPPSYNTGDQVELSIDTSNPGNVVINNFEDRFLGMTILGGLGFFFLGMLYIVHAAFAKQIMK